MFYYILNINILYYILSFFIFLSAFVILIIFCSF